MELSGDPLRIKVKGAKGRAQGVVELPLMVAHNIEDDGEVTTHTLYTKKDFERIVGDDPVYVILPDPDGARLTSLSREGCVEDEIAWVETLHQMVTELKEEGRADAAEALLDSDVQLNATRDEEVDANAFATTFPQVSVRPFARRSTLFLRVTRRHVLTLTHALSTHLPTYTCRRLWSACRAVVRSAQPHGAAPPSPPAAPPPRRAARGCRCFTHPNPDLSPSLRRSRYLRPRPSPSPTPTPKPEPELNPRSPPPRHYLVITPRIARQKRRVT